LGREEADVSTIERRSDDEAPYGRMPTGIPGLDEVLLGGLPEHGVYLIKGGTGTGKTTLGLQFLLEGARRREKVLFVSLSQSNRMLERIAASHGWSLDGVHVHAITPHEILRQQSTTQDVFVSDEVELVDIADRIRGVVEAVRPVRLVFDSLSFIEILATAPGRFERELASLVELLGTLEVTALFVLNQGGTGTTDMITDGAIDLEHLEEDFAGLRYRLHVEKVRGSAFRGGHHDFEIVRGGLRVFPRLTLVPRGRFAEDQGDRTRAVYESDVPSLDDLVGGGLTAGTSCLIRGPSGVGKSSLATRYAFAAATRGQRCVYFLFEEVRDTFLRRSAALSMDLRPFEASGEVRVRQVGGTSVLPGELATEIRSAVEWGAQVVVIDSLSGYYQSLPDERLLLSEIRDVIRYLSERGVLTLITLAQRPDPVGVEAVPLEALNITESVDVTINLQYLEAGDVLSKAISVIKRRDGDHEKGMRLLEIDGRGLTVGEVLPRFGGMTHEGAGAAHSPVVDEAADDGHGGDDHGPTFG
jgi:circadian clock protein KaiC